MFPRMHCLAKATLALQGGGRSCIGLTCLNGVRTLTRGLSNYGAAERGESNKNENELYDIIISGGGMVGTAMACSLGE